MDRYYDQLIKEHLRDYRQMFFLTGPRQVGKTTTSSHLKESFDKFFYFNWDYPAHRELILNVEALEASLGLNQLSREGQVVVVFDEIHKYKHWKQFLKGFFDVFEKQLKIVVTGSGRLDVYQKGGDSLMGRYFLYHMHPLTVREVVDPTLSTHEWQAPKFIEDQLWHNLWTFGGFPEPLTTATSTFYDRWVALRHKQLFQEDLRDLTRVVDVDQLELLAELMKHQAGQLTSYQELSKKVGVTMPTIKRWIAKLQSVFYIFSIPPWHKNIPRSLLKEPKYYLWDWSLAVNEGARVENFIASHLLKAVHMWSDRGLGQYSLYFLRDKEKREVDFLITKGDQPWILVEAKKSMNKGISKSLIYFQKMTNSKYAFQVVYDMDYIHRNCFDFEEPMIVPARTFLSQLV